MEGHKAKVVFKPLQSNLVNLPPNLSGLLYNASISIQDVIVELVINGKKRCYAGWSGMSSRGTGDLEIDATFANSLMIKPNEHITINLKVNNYEATQISLEPVSSSDWELVELHAQYIEDKLLSQSRCVSLDQVLVVYPNQTTSAKLKVTNIGNDGHKYAKISPYCEILIAPKLRQRRDHSSSKSSKSAKSMADESSSSITVLKRGVSLPHQLAKDVPHQSGYEILVPESCHTTFKDIQYAYVSIIPGPLNKEKSNPQELNQEQEQEQEQDKDKAMSPLKENKKIVAKLLYNDSCPPDTVFLSEKLSISLGIEYQIGNIISIKPASKASYKRPAVFVIHPYSISSKKGNHLALNERKSQTTTLSEVLQTSFYEKINGLHSTSLTNYMKIPIVSNILPYGGLLKFKKNDDANAWVKPHDPRKPSRIEIGDELLRPSSFIQEIQVSDDLENEAIGMDSLVEDIVDSVAITPNSGALIYGNSGCGKTLAINLAERRIRQELGYHTKIVSCDTVMNENLSSLISHATQWVQECSWHTPAVLILDNLDRIVPAENEQTDSTITNKFTEFLISQISRIHSQNNSNFSVLISSRSKESLNKLMFQSHLLDSYFNLKPPNKSVRTDLIQSFIEEKLDCNINFDILDVATETEGFLPNDLKILCERIYHDALFYSTESDSKLVIEKENVQQALKDFTPSNLQGVKLQKSTISWNDIGGLNNVKDILLETLEWPTKYAPIFSNCSLRLRSGILLYGYPGCGKTLLASAVAGQCGLNFISIKGPEILNKYIGASEQSVRELFERAQSAKPCVLFFDEFDSIAPKRGHDSTGVTDRVVNQMLTQMDGAEGLDGVYVLAATSRPDLIDPALLRPGRLDKSVLCDMPSFADRLDILNSITAKMDLSDSVNLEEISSKSSGFSGADMQGLAYNAYLKAVHVKLLEEEKRASNDVDKDSKDSGIEFFQVNAESLKNKNLSPSERVKIQRQIEEIIKTNSNVDNQDKNASSSVSPKMIVKIEHDHFLQSLEETKPSISVSEKVKLSKVYSEFVSGRDGNMPDGSASNEIGGRTTLM